MEKISENAEKNINDILSIMKASENNYYERTQSIDNKCGFFIAFHSTILFLSIDIDKIKDTFNKPILSIGQTFISIIYLLLSISILILAILSICLFIASLRSRNFKYIPVDICNEKYYNCVNIDLKKQLLECYKEIGTYNENILSLKHKIYNIASILTIIEILIIGICFIFQIFI